MTKQKNKRLYSVKFFTRIDIEAEDESEAVDIADRQVFGEGERTGEQISTDFDYEVEFVGSPKADRY